MLAQGHELLRTILENQVDFYKVDAALRPTHDKLDNVLHALRSIQDKADLQPHDLHPYRYVSPRHDRPTCCQIIGD